MERGEHSPQGDPNKNIEGLFAEHFDGIAELFDGVTDVATVFANPELIKEQAKVRLFTDTITATMIHTEPTPEATEATYLTLQLIYASYSHASNTTTRLVYTDFFDVLGQTQIGEKLAAYAESHQSVMRLMDKVRPLVDPTRQYASLTNTMALITCMAIEKDMAASSWKDADAFVKQLETWDGDVSELVRNQKANVEPVDSELLTSGQDVRDYVRQVNKQLETMPLGDERDAFADAVCVELNIAWSDLEMTGMQYTFSGNSVYPEIAINKDEKGDESISLSYYLGNISATGMSLGFAYKSMGGEPEKIWFRVDMGSHETELHPTVKREYILEAYFDEECLLSLCEDDTAEGSIMSEAETALFNGLEDPEAPADLQESYLTDAAEILSICSQGLRRRMNSRTFQAMPHDEQLHTVDLFIAAATERSQVVNKVAILEPCHGYVLRDSRLDPDKKELVKLQFGRKELTGTVKEITVHDIDTLLARPIRKRGDRSLTVPGLLVAIELQDIHLLPNNIVLKPSEQVLVPVSGQDFDGTFAFVPELSDGSE